MLAEIIFIGIIYSTKNSAKYIYIYIYIYAHLHTQENYIINYT